MISILTRVVGLNAGLAAYSSWNNTLKKLKVNQFKELDHSLLNLSY